MAREELRDVNNGFRLKGYIDTDPNGDAIGYAYTFEIVGWYSKQENLTKSADFRKVTSGNSLSSLIDDKYKELIGK